MVDRESVQCLRCKRTIKAETYNDLAKSLRKHIISECSKRDGVK